MNQTMKKIAIAGVTTLAAVLLVSGGVATGFAIGTQVAESQDTPASSQRCNLLFPVGEVPTIAGENSIEGRVANPSCSSSVVIRWQEEQRAAGLDDRVCVPEVIDPLTKVPIRCTVPVEVDVEYR